MADAMTSINRWDLIDNPLESKGPGNVSRCGIAAALTFY
jgi:hypothetical protein